MGGRLKNALEHIQSEFVIIILDDYFLMEDVKVDVIERCLQYMRSDEKIACIHLCHFGNSLQENMDEKGIDDCVLLNNRQYGVLNCGPSLWRRKDLIYFVKDYLNAWLFEAYGHYITRKSDKKIYAVKEEKEVFVYDRAHGGAIHKGYWVGCSVKPLLEEYNIELDLNKRGVIEDWRKEKWNEEMGILTKLKNRMTRIKVMLSTMDIKI